ncbi:MAG: hypothetical protein CYPHOPRED_002071 [Cyphobasidiales sp. Tagirdzhanova-0007]|nr:MAG: hypothetical protein CYPHOPRED_002071 [Cyphobasidiales sp. Tagirdzhanova-0007]
MGGKWSDELSNGNPTPIGKTAQAADYDSSYKSDQTTIASDVQSVIKATANFLKYFPAFLGVSSFVYTCFSIGLTRSRIQRYNRLTDEQLVAGRGKRYKGSIMTEWWILAISLTIFLIIGFILYFDGDHRANADNAKMEKLEAKCTYSDNTFCSQTLRMNDAVWLDAAFLFIASAAMSIIWYSAPEGEVASSALEKDLQRERTMYRIFSVNWILIAACSCAVVGYAEAYQKTYRNTSDDFQQDIYDLVEVVQGWCAAFLSAVGFLYGIYVLITALMKRPTEKDRLRERGFHTKTVAHVELYYTISQFIVVLGFSVGLAMGGWHTKQIDVNRNLKLYMTCVTTAYFPASENNVENHAEDNPYCQTIKGMGIALFVTSGFLLSAIVVSFITVMRHPAGIVEKRENGNDSNNRSTV